MKDRVVKRRKLWGTAQISRNLHTRSFESLTENHLHMYGLKPSKARQEQLLRKNSMNSSKNSHKAGNYLGSLQPEWRELIEYMEHMQRF